MGRIYQGLWDNNQVTNLSRRLAIFLPGLYGGGVERIMLNLATGLAGRGHPVDLVLANAEGPYLDEVPKSVRLVDLGARRVLASLPALVHYLDHEQPVTLLSALHANLVSIWAKRLAGLPQRVVVSQHNTLSVASRQAVDFRLKMMPKLIKYFYPWADGIVAVSTGVADDLTQISGIPRENIHVIYNPIVTLDLRRKTKEPLEHPWFEPGEPPVLLGIGRLVKIKDFPTLIWAFARVREFTPVRLLILGEGDERRVLEALVKKLDLEQDVRLPGFVRNPYPFISRSSVFVLSSKSEGLPTVLVEALYCGIPVIATDCPSGPREILAEGQYGQLVPVGDIASLTQAIRKALAGETPYPSPESWLSYDQNVVVDQYVDILLGD